jgi:peptide/nickel transport system ATP-binding protein
MTLLQVRDLSVWLRTRTLVSGVNFEVAPGGSLAIVGESGSGKSVTARALLGILPPELRARGEVTIDGVAVNGDPEAARPLRGTVAAMLMQDPFTMLNPLRRVGTQLADSLPRAVRRSEKGRRDVAHRLREVGLDSAIAAKYPFQLSGGMRQRVGLAAALMRDPQLLIADEPTTALDVTTQREVLRLIDRLKHERGMGFVLITHDLRVAFSVCDEVMVLYAGQVVETGSAVKIQKSPEHPYTRALLAAEPPVEGRVRVLQTLEGFVPRHDDVLDECGFAARCSMVTPVCRSGSPPLLEIRPGHQSACLLGGRLPVVQPPPIVADPSESAMKRPPSLLLQVVELGMTYHGTTAPSIHDVSIVVGQGEAVGVVGGSGSGKTTLTRCIVGLETPSEGRITLGGTDVTSWRRLDRRDQRRLRRVVQMVFQDPYSSLNPARTVGASLREVLAAMDQTSNAASVNRLLDLVQLPASYASRRPASLSGGERQRVAIARALAGGPQLLVCDEPVSALDVSVQAQILVLLNRLREELGMSLLFIAHDLAVVRQVCEFVYVMQSGEVVESGSTAAILSRPQHEYTKQLIASVPRDDRTWLDG